MGFIIINKITGELLTLKIYKHEGTAKHQINRGIYHIPNKQEPVVIPMPSTHTMKEVANGASYSTIKYAGKLPLRPLEFDECLCTEEENNE